MPRLKPSLACKLFLRWNKFWGNGVDRLFITQRPILMAGHLDPRTECNCRQGSACRGVVVSLFVFSFLFVFVFVSAFCICICIWAQGRNVTAIGLGQGSGQGRPWFCMTWLLLLMAIMTTPCNHLISMNIEKRNSVVIMCDGSCPSLSPF